MPTEARRQAETVLESAEFQIRLIATAKLDVGAESAEELAAQLSMEVLRAADKRDVLQQPEAFVWGCYKNCKRDCLRRDREAKGQ